jgi:uncharacterized membrane protein
MKHNLSRFMLLFALSVLSVGSVFAQEEAASSVTVSTVVVLIFVVGVVVAVGLGAAMRETNGDSDTKSE